MVRIKVPDRAEAGEVVTVKTLISHPMHSGRREDRNGALIPRRIINRFSVAFNGEPVISVDLETSMAADPYFRFEMKVPESGTVAFRWVDDDGSVYAEERTITVG